MNPPDWRQGLIAAEKPGVLQYCRARWPNSRVAAIIPVKNGTEETQVIA